MEMVRRAKRMCTYSMVGDWARDTLPKRHPWIIPYSEPAVPGAIPDGVSRLEFEELKRDIQDIKDLLKRAAKYDEENGEPECETGEKVALLKRLAELVGVDLSDAMPAESS